MRFDCFLENVYPYICVSDCLYVVHILSRHFLCSISRSNARNLNKFQLELDKLLMDTQNYVKLHILLERVLNRRMHRIAPNFVFCQSLTHKYPYYDWLYTAQHVSLLCSAFHDFHCRYISWDELIAINLQFKIILFMSDSP